jgi:hypothetical protein
MPLLGLSFPSKRRRKFYLNSFLPGQRVLTSAIGFENQGEWAPWTLLAHCLADPRHYPRGHPR